MDFTQAQTFLSTCLKSELVDHAFGDAEVAWTLNAEQVASGYFSGTVADITIRHEGVWKFSGVEARMLRESAGAVVVGRNDVAGPDTYTEGQVMPGLTKEAVLDEITRPRED